MVPLNTAMTSSYANSNHVPICSGLAAVLNAKLLPGTITMCVELPYHILALVVAFNTAASL